MTKPKYPKVSEVNKILEEQVLVTSAVTKSDPDYIINASREFLTQYYMIKTGLITVNEDPQALESSMLLSSLQEEDFTALLNGALISEAGKDGTAKFADDSIEATMEEKARAKVLDQLSEMSCGTIIEHTKETLGSPRVYFEDSMFAWKLYLQGYKVGTVVSSKVDDAATTKKAKAKKTLYIKKPAELDYTKLDLAAVTGLDTWMLLDCVIKYESGFLDMLAIPEEALPADLATLLRKVDKWAKGAVELANNSVHNNTVFNVVDDPFKALFGAL
ncbi:MAG: hypothetical protein JHC33_04860 [Ignisphaera sp.]|nr:hypothetical protein [Ignisphaera sp.]